jgi:membrane protease YdiL (CAAX protease family)
MDSATNVKTTGHLRVPSIASLLSALPHEHRSLAWLGAMLTGYFAVRWLTAAGQLVFADLIELCYLGLAGTALLFLYYRSAGRTWGKSHKLVALMTFLCIGYILFNTTSSTMVEGLSLLFLVPLAEELFFRGILFPALRSRFGIGLAIVLTSVLFVALHSGMPAEGLVQMAFLSAACCILMLFRGGLVLAVILHSWWNHAALGWDYMFELPNSMGLLGPGLLAAGLLLMLFTGGGNSRDLRL